MPTDASLAATTDRSATAAHTGWLRPALVVNLVLQIVIIVTGGLVRLTGSGLGCPTWPQCVPGSFTPVAKQAEGWNSAVEFGNRLMTFVLTAGAVAVILGAYRFARQRRRFVLLCWVPLLGIVAQAVLGGIIVLAHLDPKTVSPHFLLSIVLVSFSAWLIHRHDAGDGRQRPSVHPLVWTLTKLTAAVCAVVIVLGTAVTGSGPHSGDADEPVRFGLDPRATSWLHADAVMLFTGLVIAVLVAATVSTSPARFRRWWLWTLAICVAQGVIGYAQFFSGLPIGLVAVHLLGSALLTTTVTFGVVTARTSASLRPDGLPGPAQ